MSSSSGHPAMSSLGGGVVLRQSDLCDWSDPALGEGVVQLSNESQRTAPPKESAAGRTIHVGG
jgi:hypothetical protein